MLNLKILYLYTIYLDLRNELTDLIFNFRFLGSVKMIDIIETQSI